MTIIHAENLGYRAGKRREDPLTSCPFNEGTEEWRSWHQGHRLGAMIAVEDFTADDAHK